MPRSCFHRDAAPAVSPPERSLRLPTQPPKEFVPTSETGLSSAEAAKNAYGDSAIGNLATRYWACGAGYDFLPGAKDDMEADKNQDYRVTLRELYEYTNRKVNPIVWQPKCVMISNNPDEVIFE